MQTALDTLSDGHEAASSGQPGSPRPHRRKPLEKEWNALFGLMELCNISEPVLGALIGRPQPTINRVIRKGYGMSDEFWENAEDVFGLSRYILRDPSLPAQIAADPIRLAKLREHVAAKVRARFS